MTRSAHKSRDAHWQQRKVGTASLGRTVMILLGLVLLGSCSIPFFDFPIFGFWLLPLGIIYLLVLLVLPRLWLIVLPLATVAVDLTPSTGRFIYNEFDYLFILTLASGLIYGRYRFRVYTPSPSMLVALAYLAVVFAGYSGWSHFIFAPQASYDNPYYGTEYAYKVVRGLVWGVGLVPMWGFLLATDKRRAVNALVCGLCLAAVSLGIIVLWERGTLGIILGWSAWYHVVNSLMDLSSSYRVTALFSDMHTGGEVIDGVILLLLPAALYGSLHGKSLSLRMLGVAACVALAYTTMVGFTRTTYVALAVGLLFYAALVYWQRREAGLPSPVPIHWLLATLLAGLVIAISAYRFAGSYGLASYGGLLTLALVGARLDYSRQSRVALLVAALLLIGFAVNAHFSSRWAEPSWWVACQLFVGLALVFAIAFKLFQGAAKVSIFDRLFLLGICVMLPGMCAIAMGGYQMGNRFSQVEGDLETRQGHWRKVTESSAEDLLSRFIGNGVGSLPARYIAAYPDRVRDVGSFTVVSEGRTRFLRVGDGRDLTLGQRVTVEPNVPYTVELRMRAEQKGRLYVYLCERNQIYASKYQSRCSGEVARFENSDGQFFETTLELNSKNVGERSSLRRWPTLLTLVYRGDEGNLDIDSIRLSADGFNLLHNSSFSRGLDNWFSYFDFAHLPWHAKNGFLLVWFETGWLGLGLFVALLGLLLNATFRPHALDSLAPVYAVGVITLCVFGFFGSPLDSARVSWLFHFYLFAGLASLRRGQRVKHRRSRLSSPEGSRESTLHGESGR